VNPNGADTHIWFLYGASSTLSGATQTTSQDIGSGTTATAVTANLSSLSAGATYYFEVVAQNVTGTTDGGINSFTTYAAPASFTIAGTAVTISSPGATSTSTITVTPSYGFIGNVALQATITSSPSGAQYPPTFSFNPAPVSITTSSAGTSTLTVYTTADTYVALASPTHKGLPWYTEGGAALACILLFGIPARRRRWRNLLGMVALFVILAGGVLSCGGGGGATGGGTGVTGTTTGNYTVTVTGTSGSTSIMSQPIMLTVN